MRPAQRRKGFLAPAARVGPPVELETQNAGSGSLLGGGAG